MARDCLSKRVILVVLNRGHVFVASQSIQAELSPLVCPTAPYLSVQSLTNHSEICRFASSLLAKKPVMVMQSERKHALLDEACNSQAHA